MVIVLKVIVKYVKLVDINGSCLICKLKCFVCENSIVCKVCYFFLVKKIKYWI